MWLVLSDETVFNCNYASLTANDNTALNVTVYDKWIFMGEVYHEENQSIIR